MSEEEPSSEEPRNAGAGQPARVNKSGGRDRGEVLRPVMQEVIEELHVAMRSGSATNPLLEKISSEHIDRLLAADERDSEREHERYKLRTEERKQRQKLQAERQKGLLEARAYRERVQLICISFVAGLVLVLVFALCWLFLAYGQVQYVVIILSDLFAFVGGIGIGRWSVKAQKVSNEPQQQSEG